MATRVSRSPESILNQPIDKAYLITRGQKARLVKRLKVFNVLPESVDYMEPDGKTQCMESEHNKAMCSDGQHDKL